MRNIVQILLQEYRAIFNDAGVILLFIGAVIFYSLFYPIPYSNEVLKEVPTAIIDLDHSSMSRKLCRMMDAHENISVAARPQSQVEAEKMFYEGKVFGILIIPRDFERNIQRSKQTTLTAYCDASNFVIYRQMMGGFIQTCGTLSAGIEIKRMQAGGFLEEQSKKARDPLPLVAVPLFNPSGGYASYAVPAVLTLILQQTLLIGIGMLRGTAREKQAIADERCEAASAGAASLVLGKTGAYLSIYLFNAAYYYIILPRLYNYPLRVHLFDLILMTIPFLLAVCFMGLALSSLFRWREHSMLAILFTSAPLLFLVGFSWPKESIPIWLRAISYLLPSTAGIDGFLRIDQMGARIQDVRFDWLVLCGLSVMYFFLACLATKASRDEQSHRVPNGQAPEKQSGIPRFTGRL